jgi:hypothetical protein
MPLVLGLLQLRRLLSEWNNSHEKERMPSIRGILTREHLTFQTWMSTPPSASWQLYDTYCKHVLCNTEGLCCLSLRYPFLCIYRAKLVKNYICQCPAIPRITSVDYEFPNRKRFTSGVYVPFCPNLLPMQSPPPHASPTTLSPLFTTASVLSARAVIVLKIYWPCWSHECHSAAICKRKCTSYNIVMCMSDYRQGLDWWINLLTTYRS